MGRTPNPFSGLRKVAGAKIGGVAVKVYACRGCGLQARPGEKPSQCVKCGRIDFERLDSLGEAGRWATLRMLEARGLIAGLRRQVRYPLTAWRDGAAVTVGHYVADFVYRRDGEEIIEDFKGGAADPLALWKLRHMAAQGQPVKVTKG